jgi:hypothetical protein
MSVALFSLDHNMKAFIGLHVNRIEGNIFEEHNVKKRK